MEVKSMGNKKGKYGVKARSNYQSQQMRSAKRKRFSTGIIVLLLFAVIVVAAAIVVFSQPPQPQGATTTYPNNVAGIFYDNSTIGSDGKLAKLPFSFANASKLVFVDLKLETQTNELTYQGRTIPLAYYKGGEYLPLVIISTPSGKTLTGIRVCEPCGSFSFHIKEGKYLECDSCGTRWDIETLQGVSGGCPDYPPPQLPTTIGEYIEVDLSSLPIKAV